MVPPAPPELAPLAHEGPALSREVLYRSLFEHALLEVHIWSVERDADGRIRTWRLVDANPVALRSWKRELSEVVGRRAEVIFPAGDPIETFLPVVEEILRTGRPKEWELSFPGTDQILHMVSYPVGEYFVSTGFDLTAHRRQERELKEALSSLKHSIEAGGVGLWDWDLTTDQVRYSDEWRRQLGYAPHELDNTFEQWRNLLHPDDRASALARVERAIDSEAITYEAVFRLRHKDGGFRWVLAQASVERGPEGAALRMQGSHLDITERRRLEERVLEAQKLESVATLAAGIAHDFNNLLTAVTGNLSLLDEMSLDDAEAREVLDDVRSAASRARALTGQLLTFTKGGAPVRELASIRELVADTASFVLRGGSARLELDIADDLASVEADVGQLSQVVNNLVLNARQAMPSGGTVRVAAGNVALSADALEDLPPGVYVEITVADEGVGISREALPRVFDPFFSTKPGGSGLGLSTSYAIVARHGGRLAVDSSPGAGTRFQVLLPASRSRAAPAEAPRLVRGAGRVLVMDDDEALRRLMARLLARLGYAAEVVEDGDAAFERYVEARRAGEGFDVVILDLTISGKPGGTAALDRIRAVDPGVRALVASGYAEDDVIANFRQHGFAGRIRKPFDTASLSAELDRVLGGPWSGEPERAR